MVRRSSRVAFAISWLVLLVAAVLAWTKVLRMPEGRGDVAELLVATLAGALGLLLLMSWLSDYESRDR